MKLLRSLRHLLCTVSLYFGLALLFSAAAGQKPCSSPVWTVDLTADYHLREFELPKHARNQLPTFWKRQQGISFLSPDVLAIYQVIENDEISAPVAKSLSGGGGRYSLQVVVLDATNGAALRTLTFVTSGKDPSAVYPTHDGKFLVRTGDQIRIFSAAIEELVSAHLPHSPTANADWFSVKVLSAGKAILVTYAAEDEKQFTSGYAVLDADTLAAMPSEQLPVDEASIVRRRVDFTPKTYACGIGGFLRLSSQLYAGYGCKELKLYSESQLLWNIPIHGAIGQISGNEALLAAAIYHEPADPLDFGLPSRPLRTDIFDISSKSLRCSIPADKESRNVSPRIFLAVPQSNLVAIIEGKQLSLYKF